MVNIDWFSNHYKSQDKWSILIGSATTIDRQIMISGKTGTFFIVRLFSHKMTQIREKCSFFCSVFI